MLHNTIFVLFLKHTDGRDVPVEPVSVIDYATWDENPEWLDTEREKQLKAYKATEAKWVELRLGEKTFAKIQNMFLDVVLGGATE